MREGNISGLLWDFTCCLCLVWGCRTDLFKFVLTYGGVYSSWGKKGMCLPLFFQIFSTENVRNAYRKKRKKKTIHTCTTLPSFCSLPTSPVVVCRVPFFLHPTKRWDTANAELKVPTDEVPQLSKIPVFKPEVDQIWNITDCKRSDNQKLFFVVLLCVLKCVLFVCLFV